MTRLRLSQEEVINDFIKIHGKKYNYSKFVYNGILNKSIIICSDHGKFSQTPDSHLSKKWI